MGMQYNPLYIYGGVGLGKTHLMQAIGHRYLDLHPKARVRCISAQDFISEYTTATRDSSSSRKALQMFDERYRNLDLLLIDDVQSFSGAKGSQAQFYRAFEALVPHNKQVVLTADTYTRNLKDIEQRLISRFSQGLSVAIEPPELEMRIAILLNKAKALGAALPEEVAMFIAKRLKSNVRELEGRPSAGHRLPAVPAVGRQGNHDRHRQARPSRPVLGQQQPDHDREHPEDRRRLLQHQGRGNAFEAPPRQHRQAAPDCHVPHQGADPAQPPPKSAPTSAAETTRPSCTPCERSLRNVRATPSSITRSTCSSR